MNYRILIGHSILSRIFYISICTCSHYFLQHYDISTNLNKSKSIFTSLLKWDAVHFRDITINGYLQEHTLAFFPLLPYLTRALYILLNSPFILFYHRSLIDQFTVGIVLNNLIFVTNSLLLYKLTAYFFDTSMALFSFYFYIFNPASVICSSMYSESLFMLLFLIGLFCKLSQKNKQTTLVLSLSVLCRSNGLLFCILLFDCKWCIANLIFFLIPIGLFQLYGLYKIMSFRIFTDLKSYLELINDQPYTLTLKDGKALESFYYKKNILSVSKTVCVASRRPLLILKNMNITVPYSMVQKRYWDQGFLKFFTIPNIPNVIIGFPFLYFTFYVLLINDLKSTKNTNILKSLKILLMLKAVLSSFFFHWNMYFRLISFNPLFYWSISKIYLKGKHHVMFRLFLKYYLAFSVSYAILFGAFYPPA